MANQGKVFFQDSHVGAITKETDGSFRFEYKTDAISSASLTLPIQKDPHKAEDLFPFFDGLIPEGWLLNLVQKNWKIPKDDRMALLLTTCQDCVGASSVKGSEKVMPQANPVIKHLAYESIQHKSDCCLICMQNLDAKENIYHAQCAHALFGFSHAPFIDVDQSDLERLALLQINQRLTLTGVQKKLSLSPLINSSGQHPYKNRLTIVGLDGRFILKPATDEFPEMPMVEHISMKLAELHGLNMAECGLVYLASGELAYLTRRFDRVDNQKILMEDFCQLSRQMTSKKYSSSSEKMGKVIEEFSTTPVDDKVTLFHVILFSYWIGNADMHLKNFSLWKDPKTNLMRMSPGYDYLSTSMLISAKDDNEELALPVNGKKNKLMWKDFEALANNLKISLKVANRIKERMIDLFPATQELIYRSFLNEETKDKFIQLIEERSRVLTK